MKKCYLILVAVFTAFMLTACGMSAEEIATYMTSLESSYQNGAYEQAQSEIKKLDKSTKNMTEEQKTKFNELKSSVEYAVTSSAAINEGLNNAQSQIDQKMYYEANQELDKIIATYTMPPAEQKKFDEKKAAVDNGIKRVKANEAMEKAEATLNSGDYEGASNELGNVDTSALSEEQQQKYQALQNKIATAKAEAEAAAKAKAEAEAKAKAEAAAKSGISAAQAQSIALQQVSGSVQYVRSTTYNGIDAYSVNILDGDGYERSVIINKSSGGVLIVL